MSGRGIGFQLGIGLLCGVLALPAWAILPDEEPAPKAVPRAAPKPKPKPKPKPAPAPRKPVARKEVTREMNCYTEGSRRICVEEIGGGEAAGGTPASTSHASGKLIKDCPDCPEMIPLPGGDIAMGKYEVTRGQFARFINETGHATQNDCYTWTGSEWKQQGGSWRAPGFDQTEDHPVVCVDWNDAVAYAAWLSDKTGHDYRLPTEQEWFSACQAGGDHEYCGSDAIDAVAWYDGNSGGRTHPVGRKQPNARGLYDMSGNVWEWTKDCWEGDCGKRVVRGGSWSDEPENVRAADRGRIGTGGRFNDEGFRLARTLP